MKISEQVAALEARVVVDDECVELLSAIKGRVWGEARCDPLNDSTQKFAAGLMPWIERLNEKLNFSR